MNYLDFITEAQEDAFMEYAMSSEAYFNWAEDQEDDDTGFLDFMAAHDEDDLKEITSRFLEQSGPEPTTVC